MMHNISRKKELVVQIPHVPLVPRKTRINVPKKFVAHPKVENDLFMYSIHNIAKKEVQNQRRVGKFLEMMCMLDDLAYGSNILRINHQDENYMLRLRLIVRSNQHHFLGKERPDYHNENTSIKLCMLSKIVKMKMHKFFK